MAELKNCCYALHRSLVPPSPLSLLRVDQQFYPVVRHTGSSAAARTWRRQIPRWCSHFFQLERARPSSSAADPDIAAVRCLHPSARVLADGLQVVESGEFLSSFAALMSFLIFFKPMLEETNWIYKLDLHIEL
jgi:hypothetical protein